MLALSQEICYNKKSNAYDLGWKPSKSEVIGSCGGDEKTKDHAEPTKSNAKKKHTKTKYKILSIK